MRLTKTELYVLRMGMGGDLKDYVLLHHIMDIKHYYDLQERLKKELRRCNT